jgi:internalin A
MKKNFLLSIAPVILLQVSSVSSQPRQTQPKNFIGWCLQSEPQPDTKRTIETLLKVAGTEDCKIANAKLANINELSLSDQKIVDLRPIAGFTKLTKLKLDTNQISDLQPISNLINLTELALNQNRITDIKALAKLTKLTKLKLNNIVEEWKVIAKENESIERATPLKRPNELGGNKISDLRPLTKLINLTELNLNENQINDLKPLTRLNKIVRLKLSFNQIKDVRYLADLVETKELHLNNNQIDNIQPLLRLNKATFIKVSNNLIKNKACPIEPISVCQF